MFNFERLETWQKPISFTDMVYEVTRNFPADERFGLTNQMRRAAVSVSSNTASHTPTTLRRFALDGEGCRLVVAAYNPFKKVSETGTATGKKPEANSGN
jgi:hypothetical protein